ncbi:MAG: hypothetical protein PHR35_06795 [Kiritimatiellae bacterium]|nr:hypothetical protein [Kiritimatiellia bacterium]
MRHSSFFSWPTRACHRSTLVMLAAAMLACLCGQPTCVRGEEPLADRYGIADWPDEPEWRALTNHLQACYLAVRMRCEAAGGDGSALAKPTFVFPYSDYLSLAAAIEGLCSAYVVHTNANANGNFDYWLQQHPNERPPCWTAESLRAYCGIDIWGNDSILTSWAVCDRSIQTQLVTAINVLRMTVWEAAPVRSEGSSNTRIWEGHDGQQKSLSLSLADAYGLPWPSARALRRAYWPGEYCYRGECVFAKIAQAHDSPDFATCTRSLYLKTGQSPDWASQPWTWCACEHCDGEWTPLYETPDPYHIRPYDRIDGPDYTPWSACELAEPPDGLVDDRYVSVYSVTLCASNALYTGLSNAGVPFPDTAGETPIGWCVDSGFWVLDWHFPATPLPEQPTPAPRPPDTDLDGIVNTLRGPLDHLEPYGSACFLPDWNQPYIRIPLGWQPKSGGPLTIHAELTSGRGDGLAYRMVAGNGERVNPHFDTSPVESPFSYLNLNTRVVESRSIDTPERHERKVSVLRPNGRLVVFDFLWANGEFSAIGYPTGIDADRTYCFDLTTWRLRFADGVYHEFNADFSFSEAYSFARLSRVGRSDGSHIYGLEPIGDGFTLPDGTYMNLDIVKARSMEIVWRVVIGMPTRVFSVRDGKGYLDDVVTAYPTYAGGMLEGVSFERGDTPLVTATILRDGDGHVAGIEKSGNGTEASSFTVADGGAAIEHAWGTEALLTWNRTANGGNCRLTYSADEGDWDRVWELDAHGRVVATATEANGHTVAEEWQYGGDEARYISGVPGNSVWLTHVDAFGRSVTRGLDPVRGWPLDAQYVWRGVAGHTALAYAPHAGRAPDPTNPVEIARTQTQWLGDCMTQRRLTTLTNIYLSTLQMEHRLAEDAGTGWQSAMAQVTTNQICLTGLFIFPNCYPQVARTTRYESPSEGIKYEWSSGNESRGISCRSGHGIRVYANRDGYPTNICGYHSVSYPYYGYSPSTQAWSVAVVSNTDLGLPSTIVYSDGTVEQNSDWCLHGPQHVVRRDGTTAEIEYDAFGRVRRMVEPELDRTTVITCDPLGLDTTWSVTQDGTVRNTRLVTDLHGRPTRLENCLGVTQWSYTPTSDGWQATISRTGLGAVIADYYDDGSLKAVYGPGAQRFFRSTWGSVDGQLCNTVTVLRSDGSPTVEWVRTGYNTLGQAVSIRHSGIDNPVTIEYDQAGRPTRVTDACGLTRILKHDESIGIERQGLKRGGDGAVLEADGSDRMARHARIVGTEGVTHETLVYAENNSGAETLFGSQWASYDGRHAGMTMAGRSAALDISAFTAPGAFNAALSHPQGTELMSYGPFGPESLESRDTHGDLLAMTYISCAADGLSMHLDCSDGGELHAVFDLAGRLLGLNDGEGGTDISYRPGTDLPASIVGHGEHQYVTYYENGLPRLVQASRQALCELTWDELARLKSLTTWHEGDATVTTWVRDDQTGRLLRKEVNGHTVESYTWRANGQIESIVKPGGKILQFSYGAGGDPAGSTDTAPGLATETISMECTRLGAIAACCVAGGIGETYLNTIDGVVRNTVVQGHGVVPDHALLLGRDPADGAIESMTLAQSGTNRVTTVVRDAAGRVTSLTNGPVIATYGWDINRNISLTLSVDGTPALRLTNRWNSATGVRTNLTWTLPAGDVAASFALGRGRGTNRIATIVRENGDRAKIGYDTDARLATWNYRRAGGDLDETRCYAYSYDGRGNPVRAGRRDAGGHGRARFESNALNFHTLRRWNAIDLVGRVRSDAKVYADGVELPLDGDRFVLTIPLRPSAVATVTNIAIVALLSDQDEEWYATETVSLTLPAFPEEVTVSLAGAPVSDSLVEYLFDARNRLRRVTDKVGAPRLMSVYDYYPDGRRGRKTVSVWTNGNWQVSATHRFIYDRWNLIREEIACAGSTTVRDYTWGLDLAGLEGGVWEQEAGGIGGLLAITEVTDDSTNILLPVCDHAGTIHALVAVVTNNMTLPAPVVALRNEYAPYGELIECDGPLAAANPCPFGFQSKYRDSETGFWYYGHRFYDPRGAKWLTSDPLQESGGLNLTEFCGGDPVNEVDALGLEMRQTEFCGILPSGYVNYLQTDADLLSLDGWEHAYVGLANFGNLLGNLTLGTVDGAGQILASADYASEAVFDMDTAALTMNVQQAGGLGMPGALPYAIARSGRAMRGLVALLRSGRMEAAAASDGRRLARAYRAFEAGLPGVSADARAGFSATPRKAGPTYVLRKSPWLGDARAGVRLHLQGFDDGASFLIPETTYRRLAKTGSIGYSDGLFVTTRRAMDRLITKPGVNLAEVKAKLGVPSQFWNEPLLRVDISDPLLRNIRMPSGMEKGANEFFRWGGYTLGGMPEAVIDPVPIVDVVVTLIEIGPR